LGSISCPIVKCTATAINCITADAYTIFEIDNYGTNQDLGTGYAWNRPYLTIKSGDWVSWTWSPPNLVTGLTYRVQQVQDAASTTSVIGFSSGKPSSTGSYKHQFNVPGVYYYWSGLIGYQNFAFRGVINVESAIDKVYSMKVTVHGFQATNLIVETNTTSNESISFTNMTANIDPCPVLSQDSYPNLDMNFLNLCQGTVNDKNFVFTACQVPTVTSISPLSIKYDTLITINGTKFSSNSCENEVYIDTVLCKIINSSQTQLTCKIGKNSNLTPSKLYSVEILRKNYGYALKADNFQISFIPVITSLSFNQGSLAGGTQLKIMGDGFINSPVPSGTCFFTIY
jgi:plastocyanin